MNARSNVFFFEFHSLERRVEPTVGKKEVVIPYDAYRLPLIFNSIETP